MVLLNANPNVDWVAATSQPNGTGECWAAKMKAIQTMLLRFSAHPLALRPLIYKLQLSW